MNLAEAACFRLVQREKWFSEVHAKAFLAVLRYGRSNLARLGFLLEEEFAALEPKLEELVQAGALRREGRDYFVQDAMGALEKLVDSVEQVKEVRLCEIAKSM